MVSMEGKLSDREKLVGVEDTVAREILAITTRVLCEKFLALKQEGTIMEHRQSFQVLASLLQELPEVLESDFIKWKLLNPTLIFNILKSGGKFNLSKIRCFILINIFTKYIYSKP